MSSPFQEDFSGCVDGQPVTSANTAFDDIDGVVTTIASQARNGLFGLGAWIRQTDVGGAPWTDAGFFTDEVTGARRLFFRAYISVSSVSGPNMTFMWLSAPDDDAPIVSIGVNSSEQLVGTGLTLTSGSASLGTFLSWSRIDVTVTENGADLDVAADIYSGLTIYSIDPEVRAGQLTGTIAGGAALIADGAWLWLGRETTTTPTSATITVDSVMFDAVPQPIQTDMNPQPGFLTVTADGMARAELLGEWDGATYDEVEFLGRWGGESYTDQVAPIDTLWLETWPVDGAIGAPWSVNGQALSVSGGRTVPLAVGQRGRAVRPGPTGDAHFGGLQARVSQTADVGGAILDVRLNDGGTPTDEGDDSFIRIGVSGSSSLALGVFTINVEGVGGASYAIFTPLADYTAFYDIAIRLVGNEALGYIDGVLIGSFPLSTTDLSTIGTSARLIIEGPGSIGPLRAENF